MKCVIQRCKEANCKVDNKITGQISNGYLILVGFNKTDNEEIAKKMAEKIVNLRIFEDENEKMNLDIRSVNGSILSISQFTLYAKLTGRRPSFTEALEYSVAKKLYEYFNEELKNLNMKVETGIFGADMKISLVNDGPVTIIVDSKEDL